MRPSAIRLSGPRPFGTRSVAANARSARVPARLLLLLPVAASLAGCGNLERISRVGRAPEMSPVANPTADPAWRPVSMPMPSPQEAPAVANSLWRPGSRTFLRDQRAAAVGDVITVLVSIQDEAQLQNRTQRTRQGNDKLGLPQVFGMQTRWLPRGASPDTLRRPRAAKPATATAR